MQRIARSSLLPVVVFVFALALPQFVFAQRLRPIPHPIGIMQHPNAEAQATAQAEASPEARAALQAATNYPLVRITNIINGHVQYTRTHDHSTMAVRQMVLYPLTSRLRQPGAVHLQARGCGERYRVESGVCVRSVSGMRSKYFQFCFANMDGRRRAAISLAAAHP